jgi:hypothetical protein
MRFRRMLACHSDALCSRCSPFANSLQLPAGVGIRDGLHRGLEGLPCPGDQGPRLALQDLFRHVQDGLVSLHPFPFRSAYRRQPFAGAVLDEQLTYTRTGGTYIGLSAHPARE